MSEWNGLDRFIAKIRYKIVEKYVPENGIVCDIGCGQKAEFLLMNSVRIKQGYGFDFKTVDQIRDNIIIRNNKNILGTGLEDKSVDVVFMLALLEHLEDPDIMLAECKRIIKPGGYLVLTTPTRLGKIFLEIMAFRLHIINKDEILEHKHYYTKKEIFELFVRNGFMQYRYKKFTFGVNSMAVAKRS